MTYALFAFGCGDEGADENATATDASVDADADVAMDATLDGANEVLCDVGEPPAELPALMGGFDVRTGEIPPAFTGGVVPGVYRFSHVTFYIAEAAKAQLDFEASVVTGDAWLVLEENRFRMAYNFDVSLETLVAGTIRQFNTFASKGTYTVDAGQLIMQSECVEVDGQDPGGDGAGTLGIVMDGDVLETWSEVHGMAGTLVIRLRTGPVFADVGDAGVDDAGVDDAG